MASRKMIDITMVGDKQLSRAFRTLKLVAAKKIVRPALRQTAKNMVPLLSTAAPVKTGRLKQEMARAKIRSASSAPRKIIRIGVIMPTRAELGIPLDTGGRRFGYYPIILEYGVASRGIPPMRWIRDTTDWATPLEHKRLRLVIINGINAEFRKRTRGMPRR